MPSIAAHFVCADIVYNRIKDKINNKFDFYIGCILPDIIDLENSHYKIRGTYYLIPDIEKYKRMFDTNIDLNRGYLCHLLLDKYFLEEYIIKNCKSNYYILRLAPVYSKEFRLNIKRRSEIKGFNYVVGNGTNKLSLCNVENIVSVVDKIIDKRVCENEIYNISDKDIYTYNDLLNMNKVSNIKVWIPKLFLKLLYSLNEISVKKQFIQENSIKLISDNIYPSNKLYESIK